jgi:signal transduction histidine kinase
MLGRDSRMSIDTDKLRWLMDVGRSLLTEREPEVVLQKILAAAREMTDARYVALGVLNKERTELERFLTLGLDANTRLAIGDLPRGRGVLGVLIQEPRPLRLKNVGAHPQSYGFPAGHPEMASFLGVPIVIRGAGWGNLYLTDKQGAEEFSEDDEAAALVLADFAATAIDNARAYEVSEQRRLELEQAVQGLEAAQHIAGAIGGAVELERILELVVKRGRALVGAQTVLILLAEGDQLVVEASAGHVDDARGRRVPIAGSTSGDVLKRGQPERISNVVNRMRISPDDLGVPGAHTALLMPMIHKGAGLGVLIAFDRGPDFEPFTARDEQLLQTFAASAANAVAISRSVEADRLRSSISAADAERARWARELHDQTLQSLAGLRVSLSSALRTDDLTQYGLATRQAIVDIESEIKNLRAIISDLRPSLLDDLGLRTALEALVERRREEGLAIASEIDLPGMRDQSPESRDLETAIYRLVQESLTNVVKHASASNIKVTALDFGGKVTVEVSDDGRGFDTDAQTSGFGLSGMGERVFLLGGTLEVESGPDGTNVRASFPHAPAQPTASATSDVT